jgi:hypothetical protein
LSVVEAVSRDLEQMGPLGSGALAASALALAAELDDPDNSATSKSMCAKALLDLMNRLRDLAPPQRERDAIDDLAERRARRRAGVADTQN